MISFPTEIWPGQNLSSYIRRISEARHVHTCWKSSSSTAGSENWTQPTASNEKSSSVFPATKVCFRHLAVICKTFRFIPNFILIMRLLVAAETLQCWWLIPWMLLDYLMALIEDCKEEIIFLLDVTANCSQMCLLLIILRWEFVDVLKQFKSNKSMIQIGHLNIRGWKKKTYRTCTACSHDWVIEMSCWVVM